MIRTSGTGVGRSTCRRGTVVSLLALTLVILVGFLGLAIDLGMLTIAKTQAQQSADLAALTAARTLTGNSSTSYNQSTATTNAQNIMTYNYILGQPVQPVHQLTLTYGTYDYNQTTQTFSANFPGTSGQPTSAVTATVTSTSLPGAFSTVFGTQLLPNVTATATAVHRPRDIALTMDLSSSMRYGTMLGFDITTTTRTTNNPDTNYPKFSHYSSGSAGMIYTGGNQTSSYDNYTITPTNTTTGNGSYSLAYINGFYQNAAYASTLIRAFDSYSSTDGGNTWTAPTTQHPQLPSTPNTTLPGGDVPLFANGSTTTYATDVKDVLNSSSTNILWELDGYAAYAAGKPDTSGTGSVPQVWLQADYSAPASPPANGSLPFNGYTYGPRYYGETFFIWPPDPRNTTALSGSTLTSYLTALGVNATDASTLSSMWSTWQGQGVGPGSTGLNKLQQWLQGLNKEGASSLPTFSGYYTPTSTTAVVSGITSWNGTSLTSSNKPKIYYAVCRLFNRAYPAGSSWSGTTLSTGTSFSADWRMQFFGTTNNTKLFNSSGSLNPPGSSGMGISALQTYNAIVNWIAAAPDPFPTQLRAGRVKYYGSMPSTTNPITGTWPSYGSTDQRFWVEFIDHVLGFRQTSAGAYQDISGITSSNTFAGYGTDFTWGTIGINSPPSAPQYMSYTDNPARPRLRYWFGPLLMVDYLHNYNMYEWSLNNSYNYFVMQPGDSYEAPIYTARQAYSAAISTMENNHPNDWFSLIFYSKPRNSASDYLNRFNNVACPLGTNYAYAQAALCFPLSTINADGSANSTEVTPYDADPVTGSVPSANFSDTPRAKGGTCFAMGLMLAFNQFAVTPTTDATLRSFVSSSPITFPSAMAGGNGRKGTQKVIIFETDGMPESDATTSGLVAKTGYSYYPIRYDMNNPNNSEYPTVTEPGDNDSTVLSNINSLVTTLNTTYGTTRNPFRLYTVGFGPVFSGSDASSALSTLQTMQYYAGTPGQTSTTTALPSNQVITGTDAQMSSNMINTFTSILENGVQIALIQ